MKWLMIVSLCASVGCSKPAPSPPTEPTPSGEKTPEPAKKAEEAPEPPKEAKPDEVPKGTPADSSNAEKAHDPEGVALVPFEGPIPDDALNVFLAQPNPVPGWVGVAFDAPKVPEADGQPIRDLLDSILEDRKKIDDMRPRIRQRVQGIVKAGIQGDLPKGKPLSRALPSLDALIPALDAAKVKVYSEPSPLVGGADRGMAVAALSLVFAARVSDAIVKEDGTEAFLWSRRMARFGALTAGQARTLGELSGGISAVQDAMAMAYVSGKRMTAVLADGSTQMMNNVEMPRKRLGTWASSLARVGKLFRDPIDVALWERVARSQPDPLWRHEAFKGLWVQASFHREKPSGTQAKKAIEAMAKDGGKGLQEIASHWLDRVNKIQ